MRETRTLFAFLLVVALLVIAAVPAWADVQQYVVVYGEFKPANTQAGTAAMTSRATTSRKANSVRVSRMVLSSLDR